MEERTEALGYLDFRDDRQVGHEESNYRVCELVTDTKELGCLKPISAIETHPSL